MFDSLKNRLEGIFDSLRNRGKLSENDVADSLREVRRALLEADVNYKVVRDLVERIRVRAVGRNVLESITPAQQVISVVFEELVALMGGGKSNLKISPKPPTTVLMVGLQGSGKTTSSAKLARRIRPSHKPLLVACDLRRPAAVKQLEILAKSAEVGFLGPENDKTDLFDLVRQSRKYAADHLQDLIIYDTAGRLAIDEELMTELDRLKSTVQPDEILLVVDSMSGQEALNVAETFHARLGLTGIVLTKLDGDARGGAALAVLAATGVPVKFAGVGEGIDAFEEFDARRMAERIMGMGDLVGLAEKVRQATTEEDLAKISQSFAKKKKKGLSLEDLMLQFEQVEKLGPLDKVVEMLPGNLGKKLAQQAPDAADPRRLRRMKAVIQSMTPAERENPKLLNASRRRRIALGSGTSVQMVNQLMKQFDQMNQVWKQFGGMGMGKSMKMVRRLGGLFR
ncbi:MULTISPECIES: signal recognition particle protein [Jonquetella]|uniref:signal recognition particle protein n=1 Tax=Jonquetella TaxID=428711 RepID=UPI0001B91084|nr:MULTISPECIES: signal recognition particle protein [Jonquetella]EEX48601.1 signal recognition particle protein [Jonquetella anthropi E3_33 E1]ERL23823.1 signal recognition particle protein [Jonquetella sp. BV3C21]